MDVQVCFKFYHMAYGISYGNLQDCRKRAIQGRYNFVHGLKYEENNRKISLKQDSVKAWIQEYADDYGQPQPHKKETHLSDGLTLEELWDEYIESLNDLDESKKISLSHWYKVFEREFSDWLKIPKCNRFSQCDTCASIKLLKEGLTKSQRGKNKHLCFAIV